VILSAGSVCLEYAIDSQSAPQLFIGYGYSSPTLVYGNCPVGGTLPTGVWTHVELDVPLGNTGPPTSIINGTSGQATCGSASAVPAATNPSGVFGPRTTQVTEAWSAYFDNVVVAVTR
jgi:hypothetical protein